MTANELAAVPRPVLYEWLALLTARASNRLFINSSPHSVAIMPLLRRLAAGEVVPVQEIRAVAATTRSVANAIDAVAEAINADADAVVAMASAADAIYADADDVNAASERAQQNADLQRLLDEHALTKRM